MVKLIVHRVLIFGLIVAFTNAAAKCYRSLSDTINCERADKEVIERLNVYYKNDVNLIVINSSISILESGIFVKLKFLRKLSLTGCEIRVLQNGVFRGLDLTHLNLAGNFIEDIPDDIFANLSDLRFLDLSKNFISMLELKSEIGYLPVLNYVDISNNRLNNFTLFGNFSELETINFEKNSLSRFQIDLILHLPNIKNVFFHHNSLNTTDENFATFVLTACNIKIDLENTFFNDGWSTLENTTGQIITAAVQNDIEKDFKLSPELIKSLNQSELANLVERIMILRNFTLNEKKIIETDKKLIRDESRNVRREMTRIDELIKRFKEVSGEAKQESVDEYIEKSCGSMPDHNLWRRFKKWKCKKLFNWVKRLISR